MRCALLTLFCLIACKDKAADPPPPPAPPHDGVRLIQAGTPPHQALRYQFKKGDRTTSTLVSKFSIKSDGQGEEIPTWVVDLEVLVDDVLADGSAKLRFTLARVQLRGGATPDDLRTQASALEGVVITELLAPDGKSSAVRVEQAATVPEKIRAQLDSVVQSLERVTVQLPVEPIGVGATWQERRTLAPGGIAGVSEVLYSVTAASATSFTFSSVGRLAGAPQTIEQDGVKVEVTNTAGSSRAKGTAWLSRYALDVEASSVFSSTMNAIAEPGTPGSGASTIEITMATRMTPGTAPAVGATEPAGPGTGSDAAGSGSDASGSAARDNAAQDGAGDDSDRHPASSDQGAHNAP